jgi:hypothetical protein
MALGNIGKMIAGQALDAAKKNVIDAVGMTDPTKPAPPPAGPAGPTEHIGAIILGQLQSMQRPLGEDRELMVSFSIGTETFRVQEIFVPNIHTFVLHCVDVIGNATRIVVPAMNALLVCKVVRVPEGTKPVRVNVLSPRPRQDAPPQQS